MDRIDCWRLADELNAYQIALLIAGYESGEFEGDYYHDWPAEVKSAISPFLNAVKNGARSEKFRFRLVEDRDGDIDWYASLVDVEDFTSWMRERKFFGAFFLAEGREKNQQSDADGAFYAPKLAAAVRAWTEVTSDAEALSGKSPKRALEIWLRKHANEYGLTDKNGNPNKLGIAEICKVANWKPKGGASPTPSPIIPTPSPDPPSGLPTMGRKVRPKPSHGYRRAAGGRLADQLDDDIPF